MYHNGHCTSRAANPPHGGGERKSTTTQGCLSSSASGTLRAFLSWHPRADCRVLRARGDGGYHERREPWAHVLEPNRREREPPGPDGQARRSVELTYLGPGRGDRA